MIKTFIDKVRYPVCLWGCLCFYLLVIGRCSRFSLGLLALGVVILACIPNVKQIRRRNTCAQPTFDWGMHYFRAFAIVMIVITHILPEMGFIRLSDAFAKGGTRYFLFISGYLCQYLQAQRPETTAAYYRKKLKNVLCPYVICSILFLSIYFLGGGISADANCFVYCLINGTAQPPYWYIPFVTVLFLVSPFILRMKSSTLVVVTVIAFLTSLIFPGRGPHLLSWHWPSVFRVYNAFTWMYLLGFVVCRYKENLMCYLRKSSVFFLLVGCIIGVWLLWPDSLGLPLAPVGISNSVQKLCFTCVAIGVLQCIKKRVVVLDLLAKYSFALFFLHWSFRDGFVMVYRWIFDGKSYSITGVLLMIVVICAYFAYLTVVASLLKKTIGSRSRMFIGA